MHHKNPILALTFTLLFSIFLEQKFLYRFLCTDEGAMSADSTNTTMSISELI